MAYPTAPWVAGDGGNWECAYQQGEEGAAAPLLVVDPDRAMTDEDAQGVLARILACVNACHGMADPAREIVELRRRCALPVIEDDPPCSPKDKIDRPDRVMVKSPDTDEQVRVRVLPDGRMALDDAARYLGHKPKTLSMWKLQGKGPRSVKVGGRVFYFQRDLDAFVRGEVATKPRRRAAAAGAAS